jgi:hypothetical protein
MMREGGWTRADVFLPASASRTRLFFSESRFYISLEKMLFCRCIVPNFINDEPFVLVSTKGFVLPYPVKVNFRVKQEQRRGCPEEIRSTTLIVKNWTVMLCSVPLKITALPCNIPIFRCIYRQN